LDTSGVETELTNKDVLEPDNDEVNLNLLETDILEEITWFDHLLKEIEQKYTVN
jgi:hypothetical protein